LQNILSTNPQNERKIRYDLGINISICSINGIFKVGIIHFSVEISKIMQPSAYLY